MKKLLMALVMLSFMIAPSWGALSGTVQSLNFTGPITGKTINFSLYLPQGYAGGTASYPVVYFLHGIGSSHNSGELLNNVPPSLEAAVTAGVIGPCIIVFPDAYNNSWWADSYDGAKPAETNLVAELLPYIDANYRTLAQRRYRAMTGFSMGGFGASKFASKFPELFCCCIDNDGAMVTWANMLQYHAANAVEIFNSSETYFDQYSPYYWADQNIALLRTAMPIRIAVGNQFGNRNWRDYLQARQLTPNYVETGCGHQVSCLMTSAGQDSWQFIDTAMEQAGESTPPAAPATLTATPSEAQVSLNWADNSDLDLASYNIYRSKIQGSNYVRINNARITASQYVDTDLTNGTTYYYRVRALDTALNESGNSSEISATPPGEVAAVKSWRMLGQ